MGRSYSTSGILMSAGLGKIDEIRKESAEKDASARGPKQSRFDKLYQLHKV